MLWWLDCWLHNSDVDCLDLQTLQVGLGKGLPLLSFPLYLDITVANLRFDLDNLVSLGFNLDTCISLTLD